MYVNTCVCLVWTFLLLEEVARDFRKSAIKCRFMYLLYVSDCTFESMGRLTLSRHQLCNPEMGLYSLQEHVWGCMYLFVCVKG